MAQPGGPDSGGPNDPDTPDEPRRSGLAVEFCYRHPDRATGVHCTRCGKPLGTEKMIGNMLTRLAGHSMFAEPGALERLKMCADCRVLDMMSKDYGMGAKVPDATLAKLPDKA